MNMILLYIAKLCKVNDNRNEKLCKFLVILKFLVEVMAHCLIWKFIINDVKLLAEVEI